MKHKGISIFEQHVEKGVLALFVLVAAGLFVMQFNLFGDPNAVKIGSETFAPDLIEDEIERRAQQVAARLEGGFPDDQQPPVIEDAVVLGAVALPDALAEASSGLYDVERVVVGPGPAPGNGGPVDMGTGRFVPVDVPAPTRSVAIAEAATIDPFVPMTYPGAVELLPAEQPLDTRYVSVQTSLDAPALLARLESVPEDDAINPVPRTWWESTMELVDVVWERERLLPDGTWGEPTTIDALPGRDTMRDELMAEGLVPAMLPELLTRERELRASIRRPEMYPIIAGPQWIRPVAYIEAFSPEDAEDDDDVTVDEDQRQLERSISSVHNRIQVLERQLERLQNRLERAGEGTDRDPRGGSDGPGRGRVGMMDGSGPARWPTIPERWMAQASIGGNDGGRDGDNARREQLQRQIDNVQAELDALRERLGDLCADYDDRFDGSCEALLGLGEGGGTDGDGPYIEPLDEPMDDLLSMTGPVTLWQHDLTAEPGTTYRYRARVRVVNPFYGHADALGEEQASLAENLFIESPPGEWSAPVTTSPETFIRVVEARDARRPGSDAVARRFSASAQVEVYRFYYGYWRSATVDLTPGDQVLTSIEIPELYRFTIDRASDGLASRPRVEDREPIEGPLMFPSDLFMTGVFEPLGRNAQRDVLFSTRAGRSMIATDALGDFTSLVERSLEAAVGAEILEPGTERSDIPGRPRPDGDPDRDRERDPLGNPSPGPGQFTPTGPSSMPIR